MTERFVNLSKRAYRGNNSSFCGKGAAGLPKREHFMCVNQINTHTHTHTHRSPCFTLLIWAYGLRQKVLLSSAPWLKLVDRQRCLWQKNRNILCLWIQVRVCVCEFKVKCFKPHWLKPTCSPKSLAYFHRIVLDIFKGCLLQQATNHYTKLQIPLCTVYRNVQLLVTFICVRKSMSNDYAAMF